MPGGAGTVLLEYTGASHGTQSFYGPITGARYEAGLTRKVIPVDTRDARTGLTRRPGLLELREDGKTLFREYVAPPEPKAAPAMILETTDPALAEAFSPAPPAELGAPPESVSLPIVTPVPDVNTLTAKEILGLDLTPAQASLMLEAEQAGKNRTTVLAFLESKVG